MREQLNQLRKMLMPTKDSTPITGWLATSQRVRLEWNLPKHTITYERRAKDTLMGPFGGGWRWEVGVRRGRHQWYWMFKTFSINVSRLK